MGSSVPWHVNRARCKNPAAPRSSEGLLPARHTALAAQQCEGVVHLVVHVAEQGLLRLLHEAVPQREVVLLVHARGVFLNELGLVFCTILLNNKRMKIRKSSSCLTFRMNYVPR